MKLQKFIIFFITTLLIGGSIGVFVFIQLQKSRTISTEADATVLLERVRAVTKMIAVEGQFTEIVNYKTYWGYDWSPLRKKALVRVQAKVSVGYDLTNMQIEVLPEQKKLVMPWWPSPEILSVEHEMDYYDLTEGTFNNFNEADYNRIDGLAVDQIRQKAADSGLFEAAEKQATSILELINMVVQGAGWQLEVRPPNTSVSDVVKRVGQEFPKFID